MNFVLNLKGVTMDFEKMKTTERKKAIGTLAFEILKDYGQPIAKTKIKDILSDHNDSLARFINKEKFSKGTEKYYKPFNFDFNFAIKKLVIAKLISINDDKKLELTEKGINIDISKFDIEKDVYKIADLY